MQVVASIPMEQARAEAFGPDTGQEQHERRTEVVRRLMDQGVPVRALEALLPGWESAIADALASAHESAHELRGA